ncbi:MAG: PEP-CTERM sorting domain-containing protein [Armatimonadota bacterium]|nr:PEP-CTERM sorting domain-containing protein [Armatimonadota bacterium]
MRKTFLLVCLLATAALIAAPAWSVIYSDNFDAYDDGNTDLTDHGEWQGPAPWDADLEWSGSTYLGYISVAQRNDGATGTSSSYWSLNSDSDPSLAYLTGGVYWVSLNIKAGTGVGGNTWQFNMYDRAVSGVRRNVARLYGGNGNVQYRGGDGGSLAGASTLTGTESWDHVLIKIDSTANTDTFWFNGGLVGSIAQSNAGTANEDLQRVEFATWSGTSPNIIYFDNLNFGTEPVPEPASLAAFGMFGLGALGFIRRRRG